MNAPQQSALLVEAETEDQREEGGEVCQPAQSEGEKSSCSQQILAVMRGLAPYARRHTGVFIGGVCATFGAVGARLALPWPLRAVSESWRGKLSISLLGGMDPIIAMGVLFLLLSFALGFFDMLQRLYFARFALATVRDLRADAMEHAVNTRMSNHGDLIARFVGDSSRVSAGIRSFLVHVGSSLILLLGMTLILFHMETNLGLIFTVASALTFIITTWIARKIFISSLRTRKKAGKLAKRLYAAIDDESSDATRFRRGEVVTRANHTRLQGIATWSAHAIFGVAVLSALWAGSDAIAAGRMSTGDMVVFMMYALMLQNPIVRLARQGAKCGKIFSSAYRLLQVSHLERGA